MLRQHLLTKRLFLEACAFSARGDAIAAGLAISMFQDAAEMMVWTLVKHKGLTIKDQSGFVVHVDALAKAGVSLSFVPELHELNKARVGFKHYGNLPAPAEVQKHRGSVEGFLRTCLQLHFAVDFDEVTLVDLVGDAEIHSHLRAAEVCIAAGEFDDAMNDLAKAYGTLLNRMAKFVPAIDSRIRRADDLFHEIQGVREARIFTELTDYLDSLRQVALVALLRLPLADYAFLRSVLPIASQAQAGNWWTHPIRSGATSKECERALSCIVNGYVELQTHL